MKPLVKSAHLVTLMVVLVLIFAACSLDPLEDRFEAAVETARGTQLPGASEPMDATEPHGDPSSAGERSAGDSTEDSADAQDPPRASLEVIPEPAPTSAPEQQESAVGALDTVPAFEVPSMPGTWICPPGSVGIPVEGGTCARGTSAGLLGQRPDVLESPSATPLIADKVPTSTPSPSPSAAATPEASATPAATAQRATVQTAPVIVTLRADLHRCPPGSSGTPVAGGTCTRTETRPVTVTEEVTFVCPPGTTGTQPPSDSCVRRSSESESVPIIATTSRKRSCPAGSTAEGGNCTTTGFSLQPVPVIVTTPAPQHDCPPGSTGTPTPGGTCLTAAGESVPVITTALPPVASCPPGSTGNPVMGGSCNQQVNEVVRVPQIITETISFSCPPGFSGTASPTGTCVRPASNELVSVVAGDVTLSYSCPAGFTGSQVPGGTCTRTRRVRVISTPQAPYVTCPAGYSGRAVIGGTCTRNR